MDYLVSAFVYIVPFIVALGILVFVHEFGHFIVARWCGVKVEEFSIGFGKEVWGKNDKKDTRWKICVIPLGGYVKMFGDADASSATSDKKTKKMSAEDKKIAFPFQKWYKKIAIAFAGPLANYIFAIAVLALIYTFVGKMVLPPVIADVIPETAAAEAGLNKGDRVISINGTKTNSFTDIRRMVSVSYDKPMEVVVDRNGKELNISVTTKEIEYDDGTGVKSKKKFLGIKSVNKTEVISQDISLLQSIPMAITEVIDISKYTLLSVGQMIAGSRSGKEIGGIIRIAEISGDIVKEEGGWLDFINFLAILSINLGLINLFPIPILDGGQIVIFATEGIIRKEVGEKSKDFLFKIGFALIIALMIYATWNDFARLFERWAL